MFDPSKLNLDLDDKGDNKKKKEVKKVAPEVENKEKETIKLNEDKKITPVVEEIKKIIPREINEKEEIIFDINIISLSDLIGISQENEYDFLIIEPFESEIKISFRKNKVEKDVKYIKYPIYSDILIKIKTLTKLKLGESHIEQEGKGVINIGNNGYALISKVVPSSFGEKLFIKANIVKEKKVIKTNKKTSIGQIFGFLGAAGLISLILGGGFITFIVLNAQTIDDLKFFNSLGINLNDINTFITKIISLIFSILIFIETIFLIIFLFKFLLTKKEDKQKRVRYGIYSMLFLIITFSSASAWMIIDKKINSLPNWQEIAYGDIRVYDNSKLISEYFDTTNSLIKNTTNIIGPITVKYDLNYFAKRESDKGLKIDKFIWDFGIGEKIETINPEIIYTFDTKGNYSVSLNVKEIDLKGDIIDKEVANIPDINISSIVKIIQTPLDNGGKEVEFDGSNLFDLGKIKWVMIDGKNQTIPWEGYSFRLPKPIFKETLIGMYINKKNDNLGVPDKIFVITSGDTNDIGGKIFYTRGIVKDLEFELIVKDIKNAFGEGYIKEFLWNVEGKEIRKVGEIDNQENSSKILYTFKKYGDNNIKVKLTNSDEKIKILKLKLSIPKKLKLIKSLRVFNEGEVLDNIEYDNSNNEYFINELAIPTNLQFNARFVKPDKSLYVLDKVDWDYNNDGNIDESGKIGKYSVDTEGNHTVTVYYTFIHRKIKDKTIKLIEKIYISGIKKEAILKLKIEKPNNYIPVTVRFDASSSKIKNQNIVSFIWDYGDNITENRGSIVPGHRYTIPGEYTVKLKVITESGKEYSIQKKLILIPKPQSVKISSSFKTAPVYQGIDFSSDGSQGQILSYFWDFGDGTNSTEANPTHMYKNPGKYKVKLKIDFKNKNVLEDQMEIKVITN